MKDVLLYLVKTGYVIRVNDILFIYVRGGMFCLLNISSREILLPQIYNNIEHVPGTCYIEVRQENKMGVYDFEAKKLKVAVEYDRTIHLIDSFFALYLEGKYTIFDLKNMTPVSDQTFDTVMLSRYRNHCVLVTRGRKSGAINLRTGKFEVPMEYHNIQPLSEDMYDVQIDQLHGVFDTAAGELVADIKYKFVDLLVKPYLTVQENEHVGLLDTSTQTVTWR